MENSMATHWAASLDQWMVGMKVQSMEEQLAELMAVPMVIWRDHNLVCL